MRVLKNTHYNYPGRKWSVPYIGNIQNFAKVGLSVHSCVETGVSFGAQTQAQKNRTLKPFKKISSPQFS